MPKRITQKKERFFNINYVKPETNKLCVMSWNFSFAYGKGSAGLGYYQKIKYHFQEALDQAVRVIQDNNADVILLQEVDFNCKKSHYIDQLEYLAKKLNFNYAYCTSWKCGYVPFPYFNIEDHFGKTLAGGGVLSRYPITENSITLFPKPRENFRIYNYFYPARYLQTVSIKVGNSNLKFGNIHFEAFNISSRIEQAQVAKTEVLKKSLDFFGGDFNTIPISATKRNAFKDYPSDHYDGDTTLQCFEHPDYTQSCPESLYSKKEETYFTFPSNAPDRRLDYIFFKTKYTVHNTKVIKSKISDHFPICGTFEFDD